MINLIFHSNCSLVGCRSMAGCTVAVFIITGRATGSIVWRLALIGVNVGHTQKTLRVIWSVQLTDVLAWSCNIQKAIVTNPTARWDTLCSRIAFRETNARSCRVCDDYLSNCRDCGSMETCCTRLRRCRRFLPWCYQIFLSKFSIHLAFWIYKGRQVQPNKVQRNNPLCFVSMRAQASPVLQLPHFRKTACHI